MQTLLDALQLKFIDSALWNQVGGRIYFGTSDSQDVPRVNYHIVTAIPQRTFSERFTDTTIQFDLLSAESNGETEITTMYANLKSLLDECFLSIAGSTLIWMREENLITLTEDSAIPLPDGSSGLHHWVVDYNILSSLN